MFKIKYLIIINMNIEIRPENLKYIPRDLRCLDEYGQKRTDIQDRKDIQELETTVIFLYRSVKYYDYYFNNVYYNFRRI